MKDFQHMKQMVMVLAFLVVLCISVQAQNTVGPYVRRDGIDLQGPRPTTEGNYNIRPNMTPYTGTIGPKPTAPTYSHSTRSPYASDQSKPAYMSFSFGGSGPRR